MKKEEKEELKKETKKGKDSPGELFVPAGILGGMGFGFLFNQLVAGLFIGFGIGITFYAFFEIYRSSR